MAALLLRLCLHGIFRVSGRHAAALCLRIYRAAGALSIFQDASALAFVFAVAVCIIAFAWQFQKCWYIFIPLFSRFSTIFSPLFRSFVHFYHWHIGAYADFSLFFGAWLTFCLTVRRLFIELKRERQKKTVIKSKCVE